MYEKGQKPIENSKKDAKGVPTVAMAAEENIWRHCLFCRPWALFEMEDDEAKVALLQTISVMKRFSRTRRRRTVSTSVGNNE